jgi:hypothetical protein
MRLTLEGPLEREDQLRTDLGEDDVGRTWWIDYVWFIWTGAEGGWQKAMVAKGGDGRRRPRHRKQRNRKVT